MSTKIIFKIIQSEATLMLKSKLMWS